LHPATYADDEKITDPSGSKLEVQSNPEKKTLFGTMKGTLSHLIHPDLSERRLRGRTDPGDNPGSDSDTSEDSSVPSRAPTPMLDPSTNPNPLDTVNAHKEDEHDDMEDRAWKAPDKKKKKPKDVSKHTFFISNSQMKLKLIAKNEVLFRIFRFLIC
jgi:phospholipase D1/2